MLTKIQLLLLTLMTTLGGSFAALTVIGIFSGDFTFAAYNLVLIVAMFGAVFTFGDSGIGGNPEKKPLDADSIDCLACCSHDSTHKFSFKTQQDLTGANGIEAHKLARKVFYGENESRRAGDQHIGGEVLPEFKS